MRVSPNNPRPLQTAADFREHFLSGLQRAMEDHPFCDSYKITLNARGERLFDLMKEGAKLASSVLVSSSSYKTVTVISNGFPAPDGPRDRIDTSKDFSIALEVEQKSTPDLGAGRRAGGVGGRETRTRMWDRNDRSDRNSCSDNEVDRLRNVVREATPYLELSQSGRLIMTDALPPKTRELIKRMYDADVNRWDPNVNKTLEEIRRAVDERIWLPATGKSFEDFIKHHFIARQIHSHSAAALQSEVNYFIYAVMNGDAGRLGELLMFALEEDPHLIRKLEQQLAEHPFPHGRPRPPANSWD